LNRNFLKYLIAIVLTGGALYLAFRGQDFSVIFESIKHANVFALIGIVAFQLVAHFIRAWRWQFLLRPVKPKIGLYNSFKAVVAAYGLNNVVPRAGELVRPAMIASSEKIPFSSALATIVLERILDVIALGTVLVTSLFLFQKEFAVSFPDIASKSLPVIVAIAVGLAVFVLVLVNKTVEGWMFSLIGKLLPKKIGGKIIGLLETFIAGLHGLSKDTILPIIAGTVGVWIFYLLSTYAGTFVLPGSGIENVGLDGAISLLALTGISITIPTPGGTGTYHYFISRALNGFFAIPLPAAIAFATITHAVNYIAITLLGVFYMLRAGVSLGSAQKKDVA
jgi:uncharacterized protein (TIRG00374 family)